MITKKRLIIIAVVMALVLALPVTALANKKLWTAKLSAAAELHEVNSRAAGSAMFASNTDGTRINFAITVYNLSGAPSAVHIHGPAGTDETGPVLVTLCGPAPSALATCTFDSGTSTMTISGTITSSLLARTGTTGQALIGAMDDGLAYVNVHTAANPAGEARGQIVLH